MVTDPMEVRHEWEMTDQEVADIVASRAVVTMGASAQTPDPLDLTLWTLLREADALTLGLSLGAFQPTREQRDSLTRLIEQLQRAQLLAIEEGR